MTADRDRLRHEWVSALCLELLHGNFRGSRNVTAEVRRVASKFDERDVSALLTQPWRGRLVAAWIAGLNGLRGQIPQLSRLLLASETCYAGQGLCAALALMPCEESAAALVAYLDHFLARPDLDYDQHWALAALRIVDRTLGTDHAARYASVWETFCARQKRDPIRSVPRLDDMIAELQA